MANTLGILGGSFDPIHVGHLHSAWELQQQLPLDKIHFIPCAQSPLKTTAVATAQQRLHMLTLAVDLPSWVVDPREIQRAGISYTIDTLKSLQQSFPNEHLCLIMGMDVLIDLTKWRQWEELFSLANLIVMTRPAFSLPGTPWIKDLQQRSLKNSADLRTQRAGGIWWQTITPLNISSTEIRQWCKQKKVPPYLLTPAVFNYIQQNKLYSE